MEGAASSNSSFTSTSHTLTFAPGMASLNPLTPPAILALLDSIQPQNRHGFLQPMPFISAASLQSAKAALDAFAGQVSDEQLRQRETARKRKRTGDQDAVGSEVLKLRKLHIEGFDTEQVWQQARRIIASTLRQSENVLKELEETNQLAADKPAANGVTKVLEFDEDGFEIGSDDDEQESQSDVSEDDEMDDADDGDDFSDDEEVDDEDLMEDVDDTKDIEGSAEEAAEPEDDSSEEEEDDDEDDDDAFQGKAGTLVKDPHGLNDGFFSIDDFNKQTQWFEDQDAKADPNTDQASDDEVDWHTDPMATATKEGKTSHKGKQAKQDDENPLASDEEDDDDEDDEEGGPTFGNMDLYAPEGASDDELDEAGDNDLGTGLGMDLTANDIFYKDFFAPPQKAAKKGSKKPKKDSRVPAVPDDREVERAMADVRRDLFDDESEGLGSEDALSDVSAGDVRSRRSAHERRQAKILDEIRRLEAESVKKKDWTLSGEASAAARPMNSLLDEELDFEYIGKPVAVVTEELNESIEELIKRRIIDQQFDEVLKRYPTDLDGAANTRRGLVEINDAPQQKGLAEIYEEEHTQNANPDSYVSKSDAKLRQEEQEVEMMWKEVSSQLDALSSWNYRPRPAAPTLTVVSDVATVAMEDAQPTTAQGVSGGESMMAPQEVYKAGKATAEKGEVVAKSGLPMAREEMSREDRLRRHRRQKERIRKSEPGAGQAPLSKKAQAKKDTLAELKRGGVKVINRKGEVVDVEGNKPKAAKALTSGAFKL